MSRAYASPSSRPLRIGAAAVGSSALLVSGIAALGHPAAAIAAGTAALGSTAAWLFLQARQRADADRSAERTTEEINRLTAALAEGHRRQQQVDQTLQRLQSTLHNGSAVLELGFREGDAFAAGAWDLLLGLDAASLPRERDGWLDRLGTEDRDRLIESAREPLPAGTRHRDARLRFRDGSGALRPLATHIVEQRPETGPAALVGIFAHDLPASEVAAPAPRSARPDAVVAALPVPAAVIDAATRRFAFVNSPALRLLGWRDSEVPGIAADRCLRLPDAFPPAAPLSLEPQTLRRPGGEKLLVQPHLAPLNDAAGSFVLVVLQDLTSTAARTSELSTAIARAQSEVAARNDFLARAAAELRTPLNGLVGFTRLVPEDALPPAHRASLRSARELGEAALQVVSDLSDVAHLDRGDLPISADPFALRATLEEIIGAHAAAAHVKRLELLADLDADLPVRAVGDAVRLRQVVGGLLRKAVDLTAEGEIRVTARAVEATSPGRFRLEITVADTGVGLPTDRFDAGRDACGDGAGNLGVTLGRRLVERLGGGLDVDAQPGKGTVARLHLPLASCSHEGAAAAVASRILAGRLVLVVDDYPAASTIARAWLGRWGIVAQVARNAGEALAAIKGSRFDLVLLDRYLPDESSPLASQLRAAAGANPPAIVHLDPDLAKPLPADHEASVLARLPKPFRPADVLAALHQVVSAAPSRETQPAAAGPAPQKAVTTGTAPAPTQAGPRILLAEDNATNQQVALLQLRKLGMGADVANNGREVLRLMSERRYDVILMDCQMPELDGYETTRVLRRWAEESPPRLTFRPRIVAVTANALKGDRDKCIAAGMDDYLAKPVTLKELKEVLARNIPAAQSPPEQLPKPVPQPAAPVETQSTPILDRERLDSVIRGDDGSVEAEPAEILRGALDELPSRIDRLATLRGTPLGKDAHQLKGMVALFGFARLAEIFAGLEKDASALDEESITQRAGQLRETFIATRQAVADYLPGVIETPAQ